MHDEPTLDMEQARALIRQFAESVPAGTSEQSAVSLYGVFFVKEFVRAASRLSFVSFFVRSQSPFLRPDPRFADVVARRSCQGWPSRQPCGMLRAYQAIP